MIDEADRDGGMFLRVTTLWSVLIADRIPSAYLFTLIIDGEINEEEFLRIMKKTSLY